MFCWQVIFTLHSIGFVFITPVAGFLKLAVNCLVVFFFRLSFLVIIICPKNVKNPEILFNWLLKEFKLFPQRLCCSL